jgi:drug/metabolite transporter (DMT)-like permease
MTDRPPPRQSTAWSNSRPQGIALLSGSLGALASCFAKGTFAEAIGMPPAWFDADEHNDNHTSHPYITVWILFLACRGLCLLAMVACNALMLGCFVEGMQESGSVAGTALASAANFIVSAFLGWFLFQEDHSSLWWYGFAMVLVGTVLLSNIKAIESKTCATVDKND